MIIKNNLVTFFLFIFISPLVIAKNDVQTILIFGDSLSAAYNMPVEKGWVHLLDIKLEKEKLPFETRNASISGETTSGKRCIIATIINADNFIS